ncbi:MAG: chitobiase/beta-hexosaminidase C-terminal domain-containing protein, partial [Prevotella sp.]
MRKIYILGIVMAALLTITANAENRKWDFRNWSQETIDNLRAGEDWSDMEKADGSASTGEISKNNCYWEVNAAGTADGVTLTANGVTIKELDGLLYTNTTSRSLALALNYGDCTSANGAGFGPYHGSSYLWMGSSKKNYFIIPHVKAGATIKMGVESHKITDARGVNLYIGHGTSGTQLKSPDGETVSAPKEYTEQEWLVPMELNDTPNDDGTYDIQIYNTNGCHLYFIEVSEEAPSVNDARIAFVYDSNYPSYDIDTDPIRNIIENNSSFSNVTIDDIDVNDAATVTRETLIGYDVVVISGAIEEGNAFASTLKSIIAYVPVFNLNANIYKTWGYGTSVATGTTEMLIDEMYREDALFLTIDGLNEYIDESGKMKLFTDGEIKGVNIPEGSYFANDAILATVNDAVACHMHQKGRNSYLYLPFDAENKNYPANNLIYDIIINAITQLNHTKADVPQTAAPTFTEDYKYLNTDVTISCGTKGSVIYYTTDGTTPSEASTLYTGTFNVATAGTVVKAIAYADGYNESEVSELTVSLYTTSAIPEISVEQQEGKAVVTITNKEEGATVYYNITGSNKVAESSVYSEPIEITDYTVLTAFAGEVEGKMPSETTSAEIIINGKEIRIDEVAHFDANANDWSNGESKTYYYTEGNKNGYNFYNTHEETVKASDGVTDSTIIVIDGPANVLTSYNPGNGWEMRSYGQGTLWENISVSNDIDDTNTTARYRGENAFDAGASKNEIQFSNVKKSDGVNNDPYSAQIVST